MGQQVVVGLEAGRRDLAVGSQTPELDLCAFRFRCRSSPEAQPSYVESESIFRVSRLLEPLLQEGFDFFPALLVA